MEVVYGRGLGKWPVEGAYGRAIHKNIFASLGKITRSRKQKRYAAREGKEAVAPLIKHKRTKEI